MEMGKGEATLSGGHCVGNGSATGAILGRDPSVGLGNKCLWSFLAVLRYDVVGERSAIWGASYGQSRYPEKPQQVLSEKWVELTENTSLCSHSKATPLLTIF